jgi:histidyl-tRNA synthetase
MGSDEKTEGVVTVKALKTGTQTRIPRDQVAAHLAGLP